MENEVNIIEPSQTELAVTNPVEEKKKNTLKFELTKGIISYLLFQNFVLVVAIIAMLFFELDLEHVPTLLTLDLVSSGLLSVIYLVLYKDLVIEDKNRIKEQGIQGLKTFFSSCVKGFISFMVVKMIAGMAEGWLFDILGLEYETSENQSLIEELTGSAPLLMTISACIMAPINEELIFRGMVGKIIKNKKVFITVSGLIFGLVHVTDSLVLIFEIVALGLIIDWCLNNKSIDKNERIQLSVMMAVILLIICGGLYYFQYGNLILKITTLNLTEVLGSITYIIMGLYLAYVYAKHNSILLNMGIHSLNNIFSMAIILFFM